MYSRQNNRISKETGRQFLMYIDPRTCPTRAQVHLIVLTLRLRSCHLRHWGAGRSVIGSLAKEGNVCISLHNSVASEHNTASRIHC